MRHCILLFALLLSTVNADAQFGNLEARIDSLVPPLVTDSSPGLVVGIVHEGELIFGKGYGLANLSYGIPNDPKMVYNIGSVTKQFLGYAFAMLHVADSLDLDDPVAKYLDDWPEFDEPVTLRHLLTHTSGYREAYTMSELAGRRVGVDRLEREESLNVVRRQPKLEFSPGSRYVYNSTAWVILAEVLERVVGEPADEWVTEHVLQPLGMDATQIESYVGEPIRNAAESYNYVPTLGYVNEHSNRALFGGADIYTNLPDLAKWVDNYKTAALGGPEVNALFLAPYILTDSTNSEYGLGIQINEYRGQRRYRHTGGHEAFVTHLSYYPEQDLGIIVISNSGGRNVIPSMDIADRLLAGVFAPPDEADIAAPPPPPPLWKPSIADLEPYTGDYYSEELETVYHLLVEDGRLLVRHRWLGDVRLRPVSEDTFDADGFELRFARDSSGAITGFDVNSGRTLGVWFERE